MQVPDPVPSRSPWSPMGYRVVTVAEETGPPQPCPQPPASLSYRVNPVGEEDVPPRPRAAERFPGPPRRLLRKPLPEKSQSKPLWWAVVLFGSFMALCLIALLIGSSDRRSAPPPVGFEPEVVINDVRGPEVRIPHVPPEKDDKPVAQVPFPDIQAAAEKKAGPQFFGFPAAEVCKNDPPRPAPGGRETFGTAVEFARNPQEAARQAAAARKLTFLLHVSGNFEDAGFT